MPRQKIGTAVHASDGDRTCTISSDKLWLPNKTKSKARSSQLKFYSFLRSQIISEKKLGTT